MEKPIRGSTPAPDHVMLSIYDDAETTMAVTWRTCTDVKDGYVLYRKEGSDRVFRQQAVFEEFKSDIDVSNIFWAHLTGLEPGAKYFYTCGDDRNRSPEFSFKTAPKNLTRFKFICVSDQQRGDPHHCPDYSYFRSFILKVLDEHPDTAFILTGGDNTDCGQHEVQWNGAFSGLVGICERVPFMMALGNHDNRGFEDYEHCIGRFYSEPAEFFGKQFKGSYPYNGPENWKTENYSFDYGNAHFVVIGINGPEDVNRWLLKDAAATDKKWKIGTYHFPICYSGSDCQNYDAYPVMQESFEKLDLIFSGHEHNFSRSFPRRNESLYDKPSQGTIHYMLGNSGGNPPGARTLHKVWHAAFYPQEVKEGMVAIVEVDGDKITITSLLDGGKIADKCLIDKGRDEILPYALAPTYNKTRMMYKGMDPGLAQAQTPCVQREGVWTSPLATLIAFAGGSVLKEKGKVTMEIYGRRAVFTEGSDEAVTDKGILKLPIPVFRGHRDQLYIPCDGCHAFDMRWSYAERNNFISFEHESEDKPVTIQP